MCVPVPAPLARCPDLTFRTFTISFNHLRFFTNMAQELDKNEHYGKKEPTGSKMHIHIYIHHYSSSFREKVRTVFFEFKPVVGRVTIHLIHASLYGS